MALPAHMAEREPTEALPASPKRGVAVAVFDRAGVDAEPAGEQVAEHGGVALPGRLHVEAEDQLVAAGKAERSLFHRRRAGMFQHAGDADAAQFLAFGRCALALVEIGVVGKCQRLVDDAGKIAAVVGVDRRLERHGRRRDEIFLAQPHRIDADDAGGFLDRALERVIRLRASGAAIGPDRHLVGEIAGDADVDLGDAVHARQAAREIIGVDVDAGIADIGALVARCRTRSARNLPLSSSASSMSVTASRACVSVMKASERVDCQCTGRPSLRAATSSASIPDRPASSCRRRRRRRR